MFGVEQAYHGTLTGRGRPLLSAGQMVALVDVDIRTPRHADERAKGMRLYCLTAGRRTRRVAR